MKIASVFLCVATLLLAACELPRGDRPEEEEMFAAQSVFPRAEEFGVHELVDPRETRPRLCAWATEIASELPGLLGPRSYTMRP